MSGQFMAGSVQIILLFLTAICTVLFGEAVPAGKTSCDIPPVKAGKETLLTCLFDNVNMSDADTVTVNANVGSGTGADLAVLTLKNSVNGFGEWAVMSLGVGFDFRNVSQTSADGMKWKVLIGLQNATAAYEGTYSCQVQSATSLDLDDQECQFLLDRIVATIQNTSLTLLVNLQGVADSRKEHYLIHHVQLRNQSTREVLKNDTLSKPANNYSLPDLQNDNKYEVTLSLGKRQIPFLRSICIPKVSHLRIGGVKSNMLRVDWDPPPVTCQDSVASYKYQVCYKEVNDIEVHLDHQCSYRDKPYATVSNLTVGTKYKIGVGVIFGSNDHGPFTTREAKLSPNIDRSGGISSGIVMLLLLLLVIVVGVAAYFTCNWIFHGKAKPNVPEDSRDSGPGFARGGLRSIDRFSPDSENGELLPNVVIDTDESSIHGVDGKEKKDDVEQRCRELQEKNDNLTEELACSMRKNEKNLEELKSLMKEKEQLEAERNDEKDQLEAEMRKKDDAIKLLEEENKKIQEELKSSKEEKEQLEAALFLQNLEEQQSLIEEKDQLEAEVRKEDDAIKLLEEEKQVLEKQLQNAERECEELRNKLKEKGTAHQETRQFLQIALDSQTELKTQIAEKDKKIKDLRLKKQERKQEIKVKERKIAALEKKEARWTITTKHDKQERERLLKFIEQLEEQNNALKEELRMVKEQLKDKEGRIAQLETKNAVLETKNENLSQMREYMQEKHQELMRELKDKWRRQSLDPGTPIDNISIDLAVTRRQEGTTGGSIERHESPASQLTREPLDQASVDRSRGFPRGHSRELQGQSAQRSLHFPRSDDVPASVSAPRNEHRRCNSQT